MTGVYQYSTQADEIQLRSVAISSIEQPGEDLEQGAYQFDTGGMFALQWIDWVSGAHQSNEYYAGELYSRNDRESRWIRRGNFEQYSLSVEGRRINSQAHLLSGIRDRYWLVRLDYPQSLPASESLMVDLGWRAERLDFLAQGQPPFVLAFGSNRAIGLGSQALLDGPLFESEPNAFATLGEIYTVGSGGEDSSSYLLNGRQLMLWLVLLVGVVVMLWMALALYRQMNPKS